MNEKQKAEMKIRQMKSNFVRYSKFFVLVYSDQDDNAKRFKSQRYYLPKGIIKKYEVIINGKKI